MTQSKHSFPDLLVNSLSLVFIFAGFVLAIPSLAIIYRVYDSPNWASVKGQVISSTAEAVDSRRPEDQQVFRAKVWFGYEINGSGAIRRFVVMAGCDGRHATRQYYTDVAEALPKDTVILTAGCAKYRYNKLPLGDIGGIPRVLDAGQCNDSYSLAVIALKLKEVFGLEDINDLPISFDIAWYEQKAVTVLLALLYLGVKGIRLGPTLPEFLTPNVAGVLVEKFGIKPIATVDEDVSAMMAGA